MKKFDANSYSGSYNVTISGPKSSYKFTYTSNFTSSNEVSFSLNLVDQITGNGQETLTIELSNNYFMSTDGVTLYNNKISTSIYPKEVAAQVIKEGGTATTNILGLTMGIIILSNVLLGDKIELLWGFTNILQIISYFPYLILYLPQFLSDFIKSLAIANLNIHISYIDDPIDSIKESLFQDNIYSMNNDDQSFESNGIDSLSIIKNASGMLVILAQGMLTCLILYSIKAKLITVPQNITEGSQPSSDVKKENKCMKWIKAKLISTCADYKYLFFLRLGFQLYLECILLTLLNLSKPSFNNWPQILSYCVAIIVLLVLFSIIFLIIQFNKMNLKKIQKEEIGESHPFSLLFIEYKSDHLMTLMYHVFFLIRRTCYAASIIFIRSNCFLQNSCVILCCITICAYQVIFRPYKSIIFNIVMCINEIFLVVITWGFYLFVDPNEDENLVNLSGWIILAIIVFLICFNICLLWVIKIIGWTKSIISIVSMRYSTPQNQFKQLSPLSPNFNDFVSSHEKVFKQEVKKINYSDSDIIRFFHY